MKVISGIEVVFEVQVITTTTTKVLVVVIIITVHFCESKYVLGVLSLTHIHLHGNILRQ